MEIIKENNTLKVVKGKPPVSFDRDYKFYLKPNTKDPTILALKMLPDGGVVKKAFDLITGDLLQSSEDKINLEGNVVRKTSRGEVTIDISTNNKLAIETKSIPLKPIETKSFMSKGRRQLAAVEKTRFGVFDLETFTENGQAYVYAGGLHIKDLVTKTFYTSHPGAEQCSSLPEGTPKGYEVVLLLLDVMFRKKYDGYSWYCHNFAKFDSFFVIGAIG